MKRNVLGPCSLIAASMIGAGGAGAQQHPARSCSYAQQTCITEAGATRGAAICSAPMVECLKTGTWIGPVTGKVVRNLRRE